MSNIGERRFASKSAKASFPVSLATDGEEPAGAFSRDLSAAPATVRFHASRKTTMLFKSTVGIGAIALSIRVSRCNRPAQQTRDDAKDTAAQVADATAGAQRQRDGEVMRLNKRVAQIERDYAAKSEQAGRGEENGHGGSPRRGAGRRDERQTGCCESEYDDGRPLMGSRRGGPCGERSKTSAVTSSDPE